MIRVAFLVTEQSYSSDREGCNVPFILCFVFDLEKVVPAGDVKGEDRLNKVPVNQGQDVLVDLEVPELL